MATSSNEYVEYKAYLVSNDGLANPTLSSATINFSFPSSGSTAPTSFDLTSPSNGSSQSSPVTFSWQSSTNATSYNLYIDSSLAASTASTNSSQSLSCGSHNWHVVATNGSNTQQSNSTWSVSVPCPAVVSVPPAPPSQIPPTTPSGNPPTQQLPPSAPQAQPPAQPTPTTPSGGTPPPSPGQATPPPSAPTGPIATAPSAPSLPTGQVGAPSAPGVSAPSLPTGQAGAPSGGMGGTITSILTTIANTVIGAAVSISQVVILTGQSIKVVINTPTGKIISRTASLVGFLSGTVAGFSSVVPETFASLNDARLLLFRLINLILEGIGVRKKSKKWGTVYDSQTKRPLDPAYVVLKSKDGKDVADRITDLDGRFGFLAQPGEYYLTASKTNYKFPSERLKNQPSDELYDNLYHGEILAIKENQLIKVNIPMDPVDVDWNEVAKQKLVNFDPRKEILKKRATKGIFYAGLIASPLLFFSTLSRLDFILLLAFAALTILRVYGFKEKSFGRVTDKATGKPIPFAKIRFFYSSLPTQQINFTVADMEGRYYMLVPNESYLVAIEGKTIDGREIKQQTTSQIKEGVANFDMGV